MRLEALLDEVPHVWSVFATVTSDLDRICQRIHIIYLARRGELAETCRLALRPYIEHDHLPTGVADGEGVGGAIRPAPLNRFLNGGYLVVLHCA